MRQPPSLRHTVSGQGEPVLLLDWAPWESTALADALSANYRVCNVAPPTEAGTAPSLQLAADAVIHLATGWGMEPFSMVGVSLGADVAAWLALRHPDRVAAQVLVSPTCVRPAPLQPVDTPQQARDAMLAHPDQGDIALPAAERTASLAAMRSQWSEQKILTISQLNGITCATLVVIGQEDRLVERSEGSTWKAGTPNCHTCYVYDAGHAIAAERPDALMGVTLDFLVRRDTFIVENRSNLVTP